jgi:hypothetical protein
LDFQQAFETVGGMLDWENEAFIYETAALCGRGLMLHLKK